MELQEAEVHSQEPAATGRRAFLAGLLAMGVVYAAPVLLPLNEAQAKSQGKKPKGSRGGKRYSKGNGRHSRGGKRYSKGESRHSRGGRRYSKGDSRYSRGGNRYSRGGDRYSRGGNRYTRDGRRYSRGGREYRYDSDRDSQGNIRIPGTNLPIPGTSDIPLPGERR